MDTSGYAELFLAEAREFISAINASLLALEHDPTDREALDELFRAVHTLKGMAASMGYTHAAEICHEFETVLGDVRARAVPADVRRIVLFFAAADALETAIESPNADDAAAADVVARLRAMSGAATADGAASPPASDPEPASGAGGATPVATPAGGSLFRVTLAPDDSSSLPAARAFLALRQATRLGHVQGLEDVEAALKGGGGGAVGFLLRTDASAERVRDALLAVGELRDVQVAPTAELATDAGRPGAVPYIRVRQERLDTLMNEMGELVIARDRLREVATRFDAPELEDAVADVARLIGGLRDEVLRVRMVPAWQVFDRFPRLVRDAARAHGREVDFRVEGRDIELDRALLEALRDPLVHLLRNGVAHGIEPADERVQKGKPRVGRLRLSLSRERAGVRIEVSDDGGGIDREAVGRAAVERGLVDATELDSLDTDRLLRLLEQPGFSTRSEADALAGRGVGLDVVAQTVRSLGGSFEVESTPGQGTSFVMRVPLSLSLLRALLVRVGDARFALPLSGVAETAEVAPSEIRPVGEAEVLQLRGEQVPLYALGPLLEERAEARAELVPVVIVEQGHRRYGLAVDELCGQQEVVMKEFEPTVGTLPVFSGGTILSDGRPSLILDLPSVVAYAERTAAVSATG